MNKMFIKALVLMMGLGVGGVLEVSAAQAEVFHCLYNKSYALQLTLEREQDLIQRVVLEEKFFLEEKGRVIAVLQREKGHLIDYANVIMVSQEFGRSGYAFVRLEKKSETQYEGFFDIDLYLNPTSIQTSGKLFQTICYRS